MCVRVRAEGGGDRGDMGNPTYYVLYVLCVGVCICVCVCGDKGDKGGMVDRT